MAGDVFNRPHRFALFTTASGKQLLTFTYGHPPAASARHGGAAEDESIELANIDNDATFHWAICGQPAACDQATNRFRRQTRVSRGIDNAEEPLIGFGTIRQKLVQLPMDQVELGGEIVVHFSSKSSCGQRHASRMIASLGTSISFVLHGKVGAASCSLVKRYKGRRELPTKMVRNCVGIPSVLRRRKSRQSRDLWIKKRGPMKIGVKGHRDYFALGYWR